MEVGEVEEDGMGRLTELEFGRWEYPLFWSLDLG
jgi:hypothetical protein